MTTAIFSEDTNTYNLCPSSKSEMVTKKRASFTDDIVISGVTITVDNYDHVNENNDEHQYNGTLDGTMVSGSLELEQNHLENLDPKLLQAAQLFVQDLIERAKIEVTKKLASSERQALLHDSTLFLERSSGENTGVIDRIREEVTRKCRRIYNLFLNCLGHLP